MNDERKAEFNQWYDSLKDRPYDIGHEVREYVKNDVEVLAECCKIHRQSWRNVFDLEISDSITSQSATHLGLRYKFLEAGSIGVVPLCGYGSHHNQSNAALEWRAYIENSRRVKVQTVRAAGGEAKIGGLPVDGWDAVNGVVYQFHG